MDYFLLKDEGTPFFVTLMRARKPYLIFAGCNFWSVRPAFYMSFPLSLYGRPAFHSCRAPPIPLILPNLPIPPVPFRLLANSSRLLANFSRLLTYSSRLLAYSSRLLVYFSRLLVYSSRFRPSNLLSPPHLPRRFPKFYV